VIAFPKNQMARDLMMDAPSEVPDVSLRDLGLSLTKPIVAAGAPKMTDPAH
jgi:aspartyl-tRNA synthetase